MKGGRDNARLIRRLLLLVAGMFGFGFALVPLYSVFCEVTGLNGKTNGEAVQAIDSMRVDRSRTVTVEFIASLNQDMPWEFRPEVTKMRVHPGETMTTRFHARNPAGRNIVGQAVPSVAPGRAARYFRKIECFCFTQQELGPGEARDMPVTFVVDPDLPRDVSTVTLSYTFFDRGAPEQVADAPEGLQPLGGAGAHAGHMRAD